MTPVTEAGAGRGAVGRGALRGGGQIALVILMLAGVIVVAVLGRNVRADLDLLQSAQSDNTEFSLAQVEVEFLEYARRVEALALGGGGDLAELRRRFDIFYGRIDTVETATPYALVAGDPATAGSLARLRDHLEASVPLIDGPDDALRDALPALAAEMPELRGAARAVALGALDRFAETSDARRAALSRTLIELASALAALIVALVVLAAYLARLGARNAAHAREVAMTSERMNVVTATSLDPVVVSDLSGRILEINASAEATFGYRAEEAIGQSIGALLVPEHLRPAHEAGMRRMRSGGERRVVGQGRVTLTAMRADGSQFPVELSIQSAPTAEGEVFVAFLRDISDRVAAEAELVEARDRALAGERAQANFLAVMSHEIRTPLNGLLGNLALLRDAPLDARQERLVGNMETSGELLLGHVTDVLDITRYEAGKLRTSPEPVHLGHLLQGLVDSQSALARTQGTRLDWAWRGVAQDWLCLDRARAEHILQNLIGNAVKFTRDGRVTVTAEHDGAVLVVRVADTGIGIAEDQIAHVFDDFWTADTLYDRSTGGTGLGLGLVRRFVAALGGEVAIESRLGEGSTFTVTLPAPPADPPALAAQEAPAEVGEPIPPRSVLLVEDNAVNRQVAREMLAAGGHEVVEAVNGRDGVAAAADRRFDLILMDISMPVMDGRAATRAIRSGQGASAASPIVALTANALVSEREAFLTDGMDEVLTKPLRRAALESVLRRLGGGRSSAADAPSPGETPADGDGMPLLDPVHLGEMREMVGPERTRLLIERFVGEMAGLLDWLDAHPGHPDEAARVHRAAGSAATFGALALHAGLAAAEDAAKAGQPVARADLARLWDRTHKALVPERTA